MTKLFITLLLFCSTEIMAVDFNPEQFAKDYFEAWSATQSPKATKQDIENYLALLTDDVGHQHYPYDPDSARLEDGKSRMLEGMSYYLGAHTYYSGELIDVMTGFDVVIVKYKSHSKGIHPQTKQALESNNVTIEVLEIENNKVSVIRKYSQ